MAPYVEHFAATLVSQAVRVVWTDTIAEGSNTVEVIQLDCGNGYGLSIVRGRRKHYASRESGTWEVALTFGPEDKYALRHEAEDRPEDWQGTDGAVQGWLTESAVRVLVRQVSEYPRQRPL